MAKVQLSSNCDKAGQREWLTYEFWRPADFAANHRIAGRTVRHYLSLGMPSHGTAHKGKGGIRLSKSAVLWLEMYRILTANGAFRFGGMDPDFLDDLRIAHDDEAQAYSRLYGEAIPHDEYIATHADERRSWKTKFRELVIRT